MEGTASAKALRQEHAWQHPTLEGKAPKPRGWDTAAGDSKSQGPGHRVPQATGRTLALPGKVVGSHWTSVNRPYLTQFTLWLLKTDWMAVRQEWKPRSRWEGPWWPGRDGSGLGECQLGRRMYPDRPAGLTEDWTSVVRRVGDGSRTAEPQ